MLPAAVRCEDITIHTGKTLFCPPHYLTTCTCWHDGRELVPLVRFPNRNGFAFILIVHRRLPPHFWQDDEHDIEPDSTAASSFLQLRARVSSSLDQPIDLTVEESDSSWERQTAEQVAHTQRPQRTHSDPTTLSLADLIEPPTFMCLDLQPAQRIRALILQWDLGPIHSAASVVKWHEATQTAFSTTPPWTTEIPIGFSFYTDGSAVKLNAHSHSAAAVVLIVQTADGERFGGFRCFDTSHVGTTPHAETAAVLVAVLWASQLCHHYAGHVDWTIGFYYDCFSACARTMVSYGSSSPS